ncbi:MAG: alpha/beta fold hydrolase [Gammaproteobacteria bacterium]|jgi:predicted alpha/beta hydrolase
MNVEQRSLTMITADGVRIRAYHFVSRPQPDNRTMIILPATGARQTRYFSFARFLAGTGWHVLTMDYRGIGESKPELPPDHRYSMTSWGRYDLDSCISWAKDYVKAQTIAVTAHSIGGQIIPLAEQYQEIDAVLAIASQKGYWKNWPAPRKWAVAAFFKLYTPLCLRLYGRVPLQWLGLDDLPKEVARDYARWTTNVDYLDQYQNSFLDRFYRFSAPILSISFTDDRNYAPKRVVDDLVSNYYKNAPLWRSHLSPRDFAVPAFGHSGFFDPDIMPVAVWDDAQRWLDTVLTDAARCPVFHCLPQVDCRLPGGRQDPVTGSHGEKGEVQDEQQTALYTMR